MKASRVAVLVTGTRSNSANARHHVEASIASVQQMHPDAEFGVLIHGACETGVDAYAHEVGSLAGWYVWPLPYFGDLGKAGGPKRNLVMAAMLAGLKAAGFTCYALAFPDDESRGTRHCIRACEEAGFAVDVTEMGQRS
jgi:hypothetical protein